VKCEVGLQAQLAVIIQNQQNISLTLITEPLNCNIPPDMKTALLLTRIFLLSPHETILTFQTLTASVFRLEYRKASDALTNALQSSSIFCVSLLAYEFSSPTP